MLPLVVGVMGPAPDDVAAVWTAGAPGPTPLRGGGRQVAANLPGRITDRGTIVFTLPGPTAGTSLPVRWRTPGGQPERFPTRGWTSAVIHDIDRDGVAIGSATRKADGATVPIRWTFDD